MMPYMSNKEIREAPEGYVPAGTHEDGSLYGPSCCGQKMADNGGCSEGCCDDYKCENCGYKVRIEWGD